MHITQVFCQSANEKLSGPFSVFMNSILALQQKSQPTQIVSFQDFFVDFRLELIILRMKKELT